MVNPTSRPGEFVVLEDRIYRCPCGVGQIRGPMKILVGAVAWCKGCGDEFDIARWS